jgi:hypothetical protein
MGCDLKDNFKGEHDALLSLEKPVTLEFNPADLEPINNTKDEINNENVFTSEQLAFANIKSKILQPYCINCHTGKHLNYELYPIARTASQDMLLRMQTTTPIRRMPPGLNSLPQNLIDLFEAWVFSGAPEFADPNLVIEVEPDQLNWGMLNN